MNLTYWDETVKLEKTRRKLKEIKIEYEHTSTMDEDKRYRLISEYQSIGRNVDKELLRRWAKRN
jgi:hypothetical protein